MALLVVSFLGAVCSYCMIMRLCIWSDGVAGLASEARGLRGVS